MNVAKTFFLGLLPWGLNTLVVDADEIKEIDVFQAAQRNIESAPKLNYPYAANLKRREGWVDIDFVVDESGKVIAPMVVDSSGGVSFGKMFEKRAIEHISATTYTPATLNGVNVESSYSIRYRFEMRNPVSGASRRFVRWYKKLTKAIEEDDKNTADQIFSKMIEHSARNLYEDAFLNIALFMYHDQYSSENEKLVALKRAIGAAGQNRYLPKDIFIYGLMNLFKLQIDFRDYQGATDTYNRLEKLDKNKQYTITLEPFINEIAKLKSSNQEYALPATINNRGRWDIGLLRTGFSLHKVEGEINELRLNCRNKSVFFEALIDSNYIVPKSYGKCNLIVKGKPDTKFSLSQFQAKLPDKK